MINQQQIQKGLSNINSIQQLLDQFSQNGRNIFGKKQQIYVFMSCPYTEDQQIYMQDLKLTLNTTKEIFTDNRKSSTINEHFFNLFKRCVINKEAKNMALNQFNSQNIRNSITNSQEFQHANQNIDLLIDSSHDFQQSAQLAILSSILGQYLISNDNKFIEMLFEYSSIIRCQSLQDNQTQSQSQITRNYNSNNHRFQSEQNKQDSYQKPSFYQNSSNNNSNTQSFQHQNQISQDINILKQNNFIVNDHNNNNNNNKFLYADQNLSFQQNICPQSRKDQQKSNNNQKSYNNYDYMQNASNQNQMPQTNNFVTQSQITHNNYSNNVQQAHQNHRFQSDIYPQNKQDWQQKPSNNQNIYQNYSNVQATQYQNQMPQAMNFVYSNENNNQNTINALKQPTYYDYIKKRSEGGSLNLDFIEQLKIEFFELNNKQQFYYNVNQNFTDIFKTQKSKILYALVNAYKAMSKVKNQPREIQLISALCFLFKDESKGRILQINTGEGKSIIVALLAATQAQLGLKVDIFTSSKILAQRDCEEFQKFYRELNLKAHYLEENKETKDKLQVYQNNQILYGEVSQFGGDYLAHQHEQKNVRGDRAIEFCIVDEVDCMFIDQHNHKTILAKEIKGLSKLKDFLYEIWITVSGNSECYDQNNIYLQGQNGSILVADKTQFVKEKISKLFFEHKDFNEGMKKHIPANLIEFAKSQLEIWIQNAFEALSWKRDERYKVENNDIVVIDQDNTGQKYANMKYGKGMHQFLQLKEGLSISPITLQVNFVSHLYMFKLYKSNIIGLTGTLGTDKSVQILESFYNIDAYEVPPFTPCKLQIMKSQVYQNIQMYKMAIQQQIDELKKQNRPCLLIYQNERQAKNQAWEFKQKKYQVIEYYSGSEQINYEIDSFCIIVSTNIAGRGTDFKISNRLNQMGGLHVILTFLPKNRRIDYQAFGRAGRCGQNGSAQMIVCSLIDKMMPKLIYNENQDIQELRDIYDGQVCTQQSQKMKVFYENDEMFWKFSQTLLSFTQGEEGPILMQQEEQFWGIFLEMNTQIRQAEFNKFIEEMKARLKDKTLIQSQSLESRCTSLIRQGKKKEASIICQEVIKQEQSNIQAQQLADILNILGGNLEEAREGQSKIESILKNCDEYQEAIQQSVIQSQIQNINKNVQDQHEYLKQSMLFQSQDQQMFQLDQYEKNIENQQEKLLNSGSIKKFKEEKMLSQLISQVSKYNGEVLSKCISENKQCSYKVIGLKEFVKNQSLEEEKNTYQGQNQEFEPEENQKVEKLNQISQKTIEEFATNNLNQVLIVKEKDDYGFLKPFGILIFGAVQIGVGFLLLETPFNQLSIPLVRGGIQDLIQGVKHLVIGEEIDFTKYFSDKVINMCIYALPKFITGIKCLKNVNQIQEVPRFFDLVKQTTFDSCAQIFQLVEVAQKKYKSVRVVVNIVKDVQQMYPTIIKQAQELINQDSSIQQIFFELVSLINQNVSQDLLKLVFQETHNYSMLLLHSDFIIKEVKEICNSILQSKNQGNFKEVISQSLINFFVKAYKYVIQNVNKNFLQEIFIKSIANKFLSTDGANGDFQLTQIMNLLSNLYENVKQNQRICLDELAQYAQLIVPEFLITEDQNVIDNIFNLVSKYFIKKHQSISQDKIQPTLSEIFGVLQNQISSLIQNSIQKRSTPYQNQEKENKGLCQVLQIVCDHLTKVDHQGNGLQQSQLK